MSLRTPTLALLALVCCASSQESADIPRLVKEAGPGLVFIEGGGGSGSGFVCKMAQGLFLVTNQHVVAGMPGITCTALDNTSLKPGVASAAVGHDVMRFALEAADHPLVATQNLEEDARIGDDVAVLGNSEGSRVIAPLMGKLLGIGPDRIEVSAEFVPGNSGSPIIHVKTGKVIGIATYLEKRRFANLAKSNNQTVRRFGYRLDSIKTWQPVAWNTFQEEQAQLVKVETLTNDIARLIEDLTGKRFHPDAHTNPVLVRPVQELGRAFQKHNLSAPDRLRALQSFLASLRSVTQADVRQAKERWRYDFFRRSLEEQTAIREQFYQAFDQMMKATSR